MPFKSHQLPVVSIVIPLLRHHGSVVGAAIESSLAQVYPNVEVIVVDNGSGDSSAEVLRRYERYITVVSLPRPIRLCAARNVGLSHATGEFVLYHDCDDVVFPDRLWHDMNIVAREPRADVIVSINRWFREEEPLRFDPQPICRRERRLLQQLINVSGTPEQTLLTMLQHGGPQHSCVLYRTSVVRAIGGYQDDPEPKAEKIMLFRALCHGAAVAVNPRVTSARRQHDCPDRASWAHRGEDDWQRLALIESYALALQEAGLLSHHWVHNAFTEVVIGQVYGDAARKQNYDIADAALNLMEVLSAGESNGGNKPSLAKAQPRLGE